MNQHVANRIVYQYRSEKLNQ